MFSWYKYLIVSLVFSHLGFWSGSLFLIAPFPDLCLLVLFSVQSEQILEEERLYYPRNENIGADQLCFCIGENTVFSLCRTFGLSIHIL